MQVYNTFPLPDHCLNACCTCSTCCVCGDNLILFKKYFFKPFS